MARGLFKEIKINPDRLLTDLQELAKIGVDSAGGISRLAFSEADLAGRRWFRHRIEESSLEFREDGAANQSGLLPCGRPGAKTLLIGSHLDTVPSGGKFDGALGVLAALETARTIREAGIELPFHLEVINFTDEEGTMLGEFGSQALTGSLTAAQLNRPRGGKKALQTGMERLQISVASTLAAARSPDNLAGYFELHIEQGKRLENASLNIGVVTSIVGIRSSWITFIGEAAHAGTTPIAARRDALKGAAAFIENATRIVHNRFGRCTVRHLLRHRRRIQ